MSLIPVESYLRYLLGHWMNVNNSSEHLDPNKQSGSHKRNKSADISANEIHKHNHIDIEFQDGPTKFFCKVLQHNNYY